MARREAASPRPEEETMRKTLAVSACLLAALGACAGPSAFAQSYPGRPVRVIIPLPPGGAMDAVVRGMTQKLGENLGHNFIIDNRPGAGGAVALETAMAAAPDGHTLAAIGATTIVFPLLYKARFDVLRDFEPVAQMTAQGYVLTVHPSLPVKSVAELIPLLKAQPGKFNYASSGLGGPMHLSGELFMQATGTRITHVPYKGMGIAYADLLSGSVEIGFPTLVSSAAHLRAGRLRALAVTTPKRVPSHPDLPTMAEAGAPGMVVLNWYGLVAPASTPRAVVDNLNRGIVAAVRHPDMAKRLAADGSEAVGSTPAEFRSVIAADRDKWARLIQERGIRGQ
jgi:tripartite-type tricarboxylate transporter receptor subunit TctC